MPHVSTPQSHCLAGAARGDITPPVGIYHRMWGAATHDRSTGVHRPLVAAVLAIRPLEHDSAGGLMIVSLDHCILSDEDIAAIRQRVAQATSFAAGEVQVSLTHTHGAGLMMRDRAALPGGDLIAPYLDEMGRKVADLARQAEENLAPASIVYGTGSCHLAVHRDFFDEKHGGWVCGFNPNVPADATVLVARATDPQGQTIATIVNYACHPTTLAWENTLISPDYVGALREIIGEATGGAPCLFLQGASGELGPREGYVGDVAVADRNGRQLAYAVLSAMESMPAPGTRFEYKGAVVSGAILGDWRHAPLDETERSRLAQWRYRSWDLELPYRAGRPTLEQTQAKREQFLQAEEQARRSGDLAAARDARALVEQMTRQIMRLGAMPKGDVFPLPATAVQMGGAIWLFLAGEHYSATQTILRQRFPNLAIMVATVTNGWQPGYVPPAHIYGTGIYQESIAMVAPQSQMKLIEEISAQIEGWSRCVP